MISRSPLRSLLITAVLAVVALWVVPLAAQAQIAPSTFEGGDANQVVNTFGNKDWATAVSDSTLGLVTIPDNQGQFTGGKEQQPDTWTFGPEPAGGVDPNKSDFKTIWKAGEVAGTGAASRNFLYLAFFRGQPSAGNANTFLTFELNRVAGEWVNSQGTRVPCRTDGDIMFSYEITPGGATPVDIVAYKWTGSGGPTGSTGPNTVACPDGATGTWSGAADLITGGKGEGNMNFGAPISAANSPLTGAAMNADTFGEASINLTDTFQLLGLDPCQTFGGIQAHSRSSTSFDSAMQDFVQPDGPVLTRSCTISGHKFNDLNGNGVQDAGEPGLSGWTFYADANDNGVLDPGEKSAVSDANGDYTITDVPQGSYKVREIVPSGQGWTCTFPSLTDQFGCYHAVTLANGGNATGEDFGNAQDITLSGHKYEDVNGNGSQDAGEPGLSGWRIYVDTGDGQGGAPNGQFDAGEPNAITDGNGDYSLGVQPKFAGDQIREEITPNAANPNADWACSDPSNGTGGTDCHAALTGQSGDSVAQDFGNFRYGTVEVTKSVTNGGNPADEFGFGASTPLVNNSQTTLVLQPGNTFALKAGDTGSFTTVRPNSTSVVADQYSVGEAPRAGYRLVDISCVDSDGSNDSTSLNDPAGISGADRNATIKVNSGEDVHCTFTNKAIASKIKVVKTGDDHVYHGDTLHYTFTVTNEGDGPLHDVALTDTKCTNISAPTKVEGPNDSGAAFLDPGDTWTYTCTRPVPDHSAGEENPIVNVATVDSLDEFDQPVSDTDTWSTRILHPQIAIDKTGPASAIQGDNVPYTLTVTDPGDEAFTAANVVITDAQCAAAPALQSQRKADGSADSDNVLNPGDVWTYTCSVATRAGQTSIANTGCAQGTDQFGHQVNACDTANTTLAEQQVQGQTVEPGTARLAGLTGCVSRRFFATVRGKHIKQVVFTIDGKKRATLSKPDAKGRFKLLVNPRKFKPGSHLLVARSTFDPASNTKTKTMKLRFARCVKRTAPAFTGRVVTR